MPISELKIDSSFMRDIEKDAGAIAIATAVCAWGQGLAWTVVDEGSRPRGSRKMGRDRRRCRRAPLRPPLRMSRSKVADRALCRAGGAMLDRPPGRCELRWKRRA